MLGRGARFRNITNENREALDEPRSIDVSQHAWRLRAMTDAAVGPLFTLETGDESEQRERCGEHSERSIKRSTLSTRLYAIPFRRQWRARDSRL